MGNSTGTSRSVYTIRPTTDVVVKDPYCNQVLANATAAAMQVTLISRKGRVEHRVSVQKTDASTNIVTVVAGTVSTTLAAQFDAVELAQDDVGLWHLLAASRGSVSAGAFAGNTLALAGNVASAETVTIGADVYEIEIVNTDSTDNTANNDFNNTTDPLTVTASVLYPNVFAKAVGDLIRIGTEIMRITVKGATALTFQRGVSGTTTAVHADAADIFIGDGIAGGSTIAVGLVTTLTPAAFAPALIDDINANGTEAFTASAGASNAVVITADAMGAASNGVATTETLATIGDQWTAATTFGGVTAGSTITNTAAANVVAKSDGTNLVGSRITDNGTIVVVGTTGGAVVQSAPATTTASSVGVGQISFWLDQVGNKLTVAAKYSDGTTKTGTVALT